MRRDPPEFLPPTKLSGAVQQELNAMRIAHVITRMIVGGAQENTLLCCQDLRDQYHDDVLLVTGPALGPEGDLLSYYKAGDLPIEYIDTLRRPISIRNDWLSYRTLLRLLRDFRPDVVHTHSAKGWHPRSLCRMETRCSGHRAHGAWSALPSIPASAGTIGLPLV